MSISKEAFFAKANQRKFKTVSIEGDEYRLREMTEADGCKYELELMKSGKYDVEKSRRVLIALMLVDDDGNLMVEDQSQLAVFPLGLLNLIHDECIALNKYRKDDIESLRKNSEPADA